MKTVRFYTLGCKVNIYETEAMRSLFEKRGYTSTESDSADVFVINTCTVTAVGAKKSRQIIHRAKRSNPNAIVAVVGCYAQASPDEVRKLEGVDIILGTTDRLKIVDYVEQFGGRKIDAVNEKIKAEFEDMTAAQQSRTRAMLKIQDGCTNFCSYCIIPYARGPVRSRSLDSAVHEAQNLAARGYTEIVLVGIHLSSYGRDTGKTLADAIKAVCGVEGIKRVRLGSLEPASITEEFVTQISTIDKLCPSFHVSMQSGCDETLMRMNRKYTSEQYLHALALLRAAFPECGITTDVMVGFPVETDKEFQKSCETVKKATFADIHVFQYSRRKGTPAAVMEGQLDEGEKARRSQIMIDIGKEMKKQFCERLIGKTEKVLFEHESNGLYEGHTSNYIKVAAKGESLDGLYKDVKITEYKDGCCIGEIAEQ